MTIAKLFGTKINYDIKSKNAKFILVDDMDRLNDMYKNKKGEEDLKYEHEVFKYLHENKKRLGIYKIYKCENVRIDGILMLDKNNGVLLEIKYALGWEKSCNARVQFQWFLIKKPYKKPYDLKDTKFKHALIIFDHFSGDWHRNLSGRDEPKGWRNFYDEEKLLCQESTATRIMQYAKGKRHFYDGCSIKTDN